jgi:hypothetical protein
MFVSPIKKYDKTSSIYKSKRKKKTDTNPFSEFIVDNTGDIAETQETQQETQYGSLLDMLSQKKQELGSILYQLHHPKAFMRSNSGLKISSHKGIINCE